MNSKHMADFIKPTIITAQQYGTKVSVEIDHSDTDIDELFDAFQTIIVGLGYNDSAWKQWIVERANEYNEEDTEDNAKDMGMYEPTPQLKKAVEEFVASLPKVNNDEDYEGQFKDWERETPTDEDQFDDYGMRTKENRVGFEWGDEPEHGEDLEFTEPNEELKEGYKKYKKALKTLSAKQKKKSK